MNDKKFLNRKAWYDYSILEKFEFGMVLKGWEVKSLRAGYANIAGAHLSFKAPHILLYNMHIGQQTSGQENSVHSRKAQEADRARIMLVKKRERNKIIAASKIAGQTVVPLELYWNKRGLAKILCAIVVGKTDIDKRETIKKREWEREKQRIFKR